MGTIFAVRFETVSETRKNARFFAGDVEIVSLTREIFHILPSCEGLMLSKMRIFVRKIVTKSP